MLDVVHIREGVDLHVRETGIRLVLQTEGPEHGERILAAVREQGFTVSPRARVTIEAGGGGLVVREPTAAKRSRSCTGPRYDDWSLPKGKLERGRERGATAALREVEEETGYRCELGRELDPTRYRDRKGRPKQVRWFRMRPLDGQFAPGDEVDELRWLEPAAAVELLDYEHDRAPRRARRSARTSG